jgi:hypothetical protein
MSEHRVPPHFGYHSSIILTLMTRASDGRCHGVSVLDKMQLRVYTIGPACGLFGVGSAQKAPAFCPTASPCWRASACSLSIDSNKEASIAAVCWIVDPSAS